MTTKPFFQTDHAQAGNTDFELMPAGKYECFIESGIARKASTGATGLEFTLKVRDDVEGQKFGGRKLWYRLWFTENTGGIVNGFLKTIEAPDGMEFPTAQSMIDYALNRAVVAVVKHNTYEGKVREEVSYINSSVIGGGKVDSPFDTTPMHDPFAQGSGPIEVSDDDLPF